VGPVDPANEDLPAHARLNLYGRAMRDLVVFDIDGVVADVRHRLHHIERKPKDWDAFFDAAARDTPLAEGVSLARELLDSYDLAWLTGRPERLRRVTTRWLGALDLPTAPLVMRRNRDFRPARVTKVDELRTLAEGRTITLVVDDDPAVIDAIAGAGFPVRLADWVPREPAVDAAQEREGRT
jgi:phosphoglycolate phosphatase-like HAD superfamily hydrolase